MKHPMPPVHYADDGCPTADQTREEEDVRRDLKDAQSGDLAHPFHDRMREPIYETENPMHTRPDGDEWAPTDPMLIPTAQQKENMEDRTERMRARRGGLPDSSDENPAIAVPGGSPFSDLK